MISWTGLPGISTPVCWFESGGLVQGAYVCARVRVAKVGLIKVWTSQ